MKSRYKAEAQTMCDAGLASYLRDKHQSRVSKGVIAGLGTGTLVSLVFLATLTTQARRFHIFTVFYPYLLGVLQELDTV